MRENRTCGSEGGEAKAFPTPIMLRCLWSPAVEGHRDEGARGRGDAPRGASRPSAWSATDATRPRDDDC